MIIIVHLIRFNAATIYSYAKLCRIRIKGDGVNGKRERELFVLLCKYINVTRNNSNCPPICELCENEKRQSFVIVDKCAILSTYQHYELIILMIIIIIIIKATSILV